ncbi:G-type lectin S-receptor-like serine/threonine-protein kinase At5g35370 [Tasmannia lanceolata]|uniref:G-type lectin S-receptor-like serine/threonine-protein kinase At5g35370 n=1 Tax=Tasmannia lanceolata TaxID=3420 RepID=UPI004062F1E7
MDLSILSFTTILLLSYAPSLFNSRTFTEFIYPNFTASYYQFIDSPTTGSFLSSPNGTFQASIFNPLSQQSSFYLCILHVSSNTIFWSANRNRPISSTGTMSLTQSGLSVSNPNDTVYWSTPTLNSPVTALQLLETGNLILLDRSNGSLWQSFDYPTDTITIGQKFYIQTPPLANSVSGTDLSAGDYRFSITNSDSVLQWRGMDYWRLSMDPRAFKDSNSDISYLQMNNSGLFLFSGDGITVVWQVNLQETNFRIAVLDSTGKFSVRSLSGTTWNEEFEAPLDNCRLPLSCGPIGLCTVGSDSVCSCPSSFYSASNGGCLPAGGAQLANPNCSSNGSISYIGLGGGSQYFANGFSNPTVSGSDFSACKDLCSKNCSCLGFFYTNSSFSCYILEDQLGSMFYSATVENENLGCIKTFVVSSTSSSNGNSGGGFPIAALILLPTTGFFLIMILIVMVLWRRSRNSKAEVLRLERLNSSMDEFDNIPIPGLPVRFKFEELELATNNFEIQIGLGGFGAVYKGTLPDETDIAVKRIDNVGIHGKKEFLTEIAIIGGIRHVNLVKLRGFCARGTERLLVYEYMNRGSLDRSLFGIGPALEWQERVGIALATARGLAYLHGGCEHRIIHCDIKPENILLHDHSQVKISDFGLSKLMSAEQSNLFTTMRGTRGYLAPEWLTNAAISDKTDVYSYGMVLLEIVRGRKNCSVQTRNVDNQSNEDLSSFSSSLSPSSIYFPLFALEMHEQGRYLELADPRLQRRVTEEEVKKLVHVALCCVHEEPMLRPSMANVVGMLEGGTAVGKPRVESLNFLRFYGRRFTEPSMNNRNNGNGEIMLRLAENSSTTSSTSGAYSANSYLSSQQISGPR